ncbi:B3 domain-containing protein [Striga hermonthica]|uniref:B3 domain-containing protein n=1 Tax=Striga hermonthica TaxID=68872 RepID=A0A9N7NBX0_STRHE|nr:B3 domain-containing protein [Striga hermonthica]
MAEHKLEKNNLEKPDKRPCFYKIIWLTNRTNLKIPPRFERHLPTDVEKLKTATLKTPGGNWKVKLVRQPDGIYFTSGWKKFVRCHSLGHAEFLIFKYNGSLSFDVVFYDPNGCRRNYGPGLGVAPDQRPASLAGQAEHNEDPQF